MKGKSVLFIDPSLHSRDGHHFYALKRLQLEVDKLGLQHASLVSRNLEKSAAWELKALPELELGIYSRQDWTDTEFNDHARRFADDLSAGIHQNGLKPDILVLPCADQVLVSGLARYLDRRPGKPPEILMWLLMPPSFAHSMDGPLAERLLDEYSTAFADLRKVVRDENKIHVYCETEAMAAAYGTAAGIDVRVAPAANMVAPAGVRPAWSETATPTILCAGNANKAKGYSLLPEAIRLVHRARPDIRFVVHGTTTATDFPEGDAIFAELRQLGGNVVARNDHLGPQEYESMLHEASLVLLPYDPVLYSARGSGLFNETVSLGIPVIAPRQCDFAKEAFLSGRAFAIGDYSSAGVAAAVLQAVAELKRLDECARANALRSQPPGIGDIVRLVVSSADRPHDTSRGWLERFRGWATSP